MNKDTSTAQSNTWARPNDAQFELFFRDAENFQSGIRVASLIYAIGKFDAHDDWDWGRVVYEWRRPKFRVRACTDADYVVLIEALDPEGKERFAEPTEVLWRHPTNSGRY